MGQIWTPFLINLKGYYSADICFITKQTYLGTLRLKKVDFQKTDFEGQFLKIPVFFIKLNKKIGNKSSVMESHNSKIFSDNLVFNFSIK